MLLAEAPSSGTQVAGSHLLADLWSGPTRGPVGAAASLWPREPVAHILPCPLFFPSTPEDETLGCPGNSPSRPLVLTPLELASSRPPRAFAFQES